MQSRRNLLKQGIMAVTAAMLPIKAMAGQESTVRYQMIIDQNRCMGCQTCVLACKAQNDIAPSQFLTRVLIREEKKGAVARQVFKPVGCNQCESPRCLTACPYKAISKLDNGIVVTDWTLCQGVKACNNACGNACPFHARIVDPRFAGKSDKCDYCADRLETELQPACVEACPARARIFGNCRQANGEFAKYLQHPALSSSRAEQSIETNTKYIPLR